MKRNFSFLFSFRNLHPVVSTVDPVSCPTDSIEPAIQQVPFAFDLLRLLPLCQQVELLFSTMVQGMVPRVTQWDRRHAMQSDCLDFFWFLEKSRYLISCLADVTKVPPVKLRSSSFGKKETEQRGKTPNDILFEYLTDSIKDLHEREIHLTDTECEELLMLIKQRDRDTSK